jgi:hypothetical protein
MKKKKGYCSKCGHKVEDHWLTQTGRIQYYWHKKKHLCSCRHCEEDETY